MRFICLKSFYIYGPVCTLSNSQGVSLRIKACTVELAEQVLWRLVEHD